MEVIWTKVARRNINDFFDYIHEETEQTANKYIYKLIEYTDILGMFPQAGKLIDKAGEIEIRQLVYKKHKIFYKIEEEIYILSVIHSSKNFDYQKDLKIEFF